MAQPSNEPALAIATIAIDAGVEILKHFGSDLEIDRKSDASPVTIADQTAEAIIIGRLGTEFPKTEILAEEAASSGSMPSLPWDDGPSFFLVDPLDGTKEFISGSGEFTVNIAHITDGRPTFGAVVAPALNLAYLGVVGSGAWRASLDANRPVLWEQISCRSLDEAHFASVGSRSHGSQETEDFLATLPVKSFVKAGSSLKFCRLAEGAADLYPRFGRTMEWDTGAGQAVLEAAGGIVLDAETRTALRYGKKERGFDNPHFIAWADPSAPAKYS
ncbi:MAG: 3'(2'),5'-bisphosphate nucleotidase CysQ [Pseudomonadota bacterium]